MADSDQKTPWWIWYWAAAFVVSILRDFTGLRGQEIPIEHWFLMAGLLPNIWIGRRAFFVTDQGLANPWFYTARRLLVASALAVLTGIVAMGIPLLFQNHPRGDLPVWFWRAFWLNFVLVPFWYFVIFLVCLPGAIRRKRRTRVIDAEIAAYEASERAEATKQEMFRIELEAQTKRIKESDQSRREEARAQCELLYNLNEFQIRDRFSRSQLLDFMDRYMKDSHSAADVERRGVELRGIIEKHRDAVEPKKQPASIAELSEWYLAEKQKLDALALDARVKNQQMAMLEERYADLSQQILEKMQP